MRRISLAGGIAALLAIAAGCGGGPPEPARLDTKNDQCAFCRMAVSDQKFAGQIVAPGEEPRFFDDIGCLQSHLSQATAPVGAVAYVADHGTGRWLRAASAVYAYVASLDTPMGSHLIAHADEAARRADPASAGGQSRTATDVFGASGPPDGAR
jgi:copper chaperone NosL